MYSVIWIPFTLIVIIAKYRFNQFHDANNAFVLVVIYAVPVWVAILLLNIYEGNKFCRYIKNNHYAKWVSGPFLGAADGRTVSTISFIFSQDDRNDPTLKELKSNHRKLIYFNIAVFLSITLIGIALLFT